MPEVRVNSFSLLPRIPVPSVSHYLTFSSVIFVSGLYYFAVVVCCSLTCLCLRANI